VKPRHARNGRRSRRREGAALQLLVVGGAIALVPLFARSGHVAAMFKAVAPLGWLMAIAGALLLWWQARERARSATASNDAPAPTASRTTAASQPAGHEAAAQEAEAVATPAEPPRPTAWSAEVFDLIEWRRFEAVVEALFTQAGFRTRSQSHGADGGVDLWVYTRYQPDKPVTIVQCKHWHGKRVGVDKVRELRGVMAAHGVVRGQFATTSRFTDEAVAFAKENGINLLDVDALLKLIRSRSAEQQQALLDVALQGEYWRPTCVNCGIKLVLRRPRQGGKPFWGCTRYPACRTTLPLNGTIAALVERQAS